MPRLLLAILAGLIGALPVLFFSPAAQAASRGPCIEGQAKPVCYFWTAKTTFVADGDTIQVDIDNDGSRAIKSIRFTGINAMELSRYSKYPNRRRGACHGLAATSLVESYIKRARGRVRLAAQNRNSVTGHRLRRSVAVRSGGRWVDLGRVVMEQGLALWLPNGTENAHNREYHDLAEQAAGAQRGMYNPAACGAGPSPEAQLKVYVQWDADGNDSDNLNGEWVDIRNTGTTDVPLAGWWVRDSWLIYNARKVPGYEFPAGAVVPAGGTVRLHVGCGTNTGQRFYWCQRSAVFENADRLRSSGDGAYLFDPQGDLRASMMYPCVFNCSTPLAGAVRVTAHPTTPESVTVRNVSGGPVDLDGHVLKLHLGGNREKFIFGYPFGAGSQLAPGQELRIWMDGSPSQSAPLERFLGRGAYVLADGGNTVSLRSQTDVTVACDSWGRAHC